MTEITATWAIAGAASIAGLAVVSACSDDDSESGSTNPQGAGSSSDLVGGISDPKKAPFDTVVVLMMENRSFDHLLGWVPGANGKQAGLDLSRPPRATDRRPGSIGTDFQGCGYKDPAHDWEAMVDALQRRRSATAS